MTKPIFIRFKKCVINVADIRHIWYDEVSNQTKVDHLVRQGVFAFDNDVRDELWGLIKLALADKDEASPTQDVQPSVESEPIRTIVGQLVDGTPIYAA